MGTWAQDIAINTLWRNNTAGEDPTEAAGGTIIPSAGSTSAVNGAVAVNTGDGKLWVKVTNGGLSGWEEIIGIVTPVTVALGGTGVQTLTQDGVLIGNGTNAVTAVNPLTVANGGTGVQTLTQNGVLIGNGTNAITTVNLSTKGHLLAGDSSGNPQALSVGATDGHVLTVASGQVTGMQWAAAPAAGSVTGSGVSNKFTYWTSSTNLDDAFDNGSPAYLFATGAWLSGSSVYLAGIGSGTGTDIIASGGSNLLKLDSSSERYKENIVNLTLDSARIYNLVPRNFKWKDTQEPAIVDGQITDTMQTVTGANDFGLIAEEVHAIFPELVTYNASSQPDGVRYKYLSVLLLAELKKLKARVAVLEAG